MRDEASYEYDEDENDEFVERNSSGEVYLSSKVGAVGPIGNDNSNCNKSRQQHYWNKFTPCDDKSNWEFREPTSKFTKSTKKETGYNETGSYQNDICSSEAIRKKLNRFNT